MLALSQEEIKRRLIRLRNLEEILYPRAKARIAKLEKENKILKQRIKELEEENRDLRDKLNNLSFQFEQIKNKLFGQKKPKAIKKSVLSNKSKKKKRYLLLSKTDSV